MKVEELRKYRDNLETLECIRRKLNIKEEVTCVQASSGPPSYSKVTRKEVGYIHGLGTVSLLSEQSRLLSENEDIKNFIESIPKKKFYEALKLYCLDEDLENPSWRDVADILGIDDEQSLARSIRRYLRDF